jgi:hypothetical protein
MPGNGHVPFGKGPSENASARSPPRPEQRTRQKGGETSRSTRRQPPRDGHAAFQPTHRKDKHREPGSNSSQPNPQLKV